MKAIDICCGPGGASLGLKCAGLDVIGIDNNYNCIKTQTLNDLDSFQLDLKLDKHNVIKKSQGANLIWGSPPCQPFSQGNIKGYGGEGHSDKRDCVTDFLDIVEDCKPQYVVFENVQGITYKKHSDYFSQTLVRFKDIGYNIKCDVVDASNYGVPQSRKRFFLVGSIYDDPPWFYSLEYRTTMADALGWDNFTCIERSINKNDDKCFWPLERPAMTVVGTFAPHIMAGPGYRKKGDGPRQKAPGSVKITLDEAKILQTFPIDFIFAGSNSQQWKQLGDAVPVYLAHQLGTLILLDSVLLNKPILGE